MAISGEAAWNISGTVTDPLTSEPVSVNVDLDVADAYGFTRPEVARKALAPNGRGATLIYVDDGTMPLRVGAPTWRIDGANPTEADAVYATLKDIYRLRGPWTITPPDDPDGFSAVVDPTIQGWTMTNHGYWVDVQFGWTELEA